MGFAEIRVYEAIQLQSCSSYWTNNSNLISKDNGKRGQSEISIQEEPGEQFKTIWHVRTDTRIRA